MKSEEKTMNGVLQPGVAFMPEDFNDRLTLVKNITGLSWEGLAASIGVDGRQMLKWRQGAEPCGGAMLSLVRLASRLPEGLAELLGEDLVVIHRGRN